MKNFLLRILNMLLLFAAAVPAVAGSGADVPVMRGTGEDYTAPDGSLATHASAREFPQEGDMLYDVAVNGRYVGLYTDKSHWGGLVHFGSFEFDGSRGVEVDINYAREIRSFELLPETPDVYGVEQTSARSLRFKLRKPDVNVTLIVNGEPKKDVLHLFAASVDRDTPGVDADTGYRRFEDRKLIYFGPGYYDLRKLIGDGTLTVPDGWDVYIAAGAVVYGRIDAWGTGKGTRLRGRGMVYNDENNTAMIFTVTKSTGMEVEGLTFHCHRPQCWQVGVTQCTGVKFDGVKIICTRYASTDGLDVINSQDCTFSNMFIRANDDAVAIKGLQDAKPAD